MANENITTALFGGSMLPEEMQQQLIRQRAADFARLEPSQQLAQAQYTMSANAGQGLAKAMGVDIEDPRMKRQSQLQALSRGLPSTPAGLRTYAERLEATDIFKKEALDARNEADRIEKEQSITTKNLRQRPEKESELAMLQAERADAVAKYGENDPRVKQYDGRIAKITTGKSMGQEIGEGISNAFGLLGKALGPALKKEGEGTGEFAAKDFNALGSAVASGTASKRNLATLETALQNSFTGKFADSKESVITSLTGLGIPVGDDLKQAASNKQLVDAMGTRYVFPLVKNFPGSLAAKELDRLEKTAPNSLQQPETIMRLVNLMKVDLAENEYTYNQAKAYKGQKQSLIGFNQADSKIEFQQKLGKLQGMVAAARKKNSMTKEEKAAIDALKQELGV